MRLQFISISVALALLPASAAQVNAREASGENVYTSIGLWKIVKRQRGNGLRECSALMNDGVDILEIDYSPFSEHIYVGVSAWSGSRLVDGSIVPLTTKFSATLGGAVEQVETAAKITPVPSLPNAKLVWIGYKSPDQFLSGFAKARYISFHTMDQQLAMLEVSDSAELVWQLKGCADSLLQ